MLPPQSPIRRLLGTPPGLIAPYVSRTQVEWLKRLFSGAEGWRGRKKGLSQRLTPINADNPIRFSICVHRR
jgi:hypothetical protein